MAARKRRHAARYADLVSFYREAMSGAYADWDESKHPRDADGKFAAVEGRGGGADESKGAEGLGSGGIAGGGVEPWGTSPHGRYDIDAMFEEMDDEELSPDEYFETSFGDGVSQGDFEGWIQELGVEHYEYGDVSPGNRGEIITALKTLDDLFGGRYPVQRLTNTVVEGGSPLVWAQAVASTASNEGMDSYGGSWIALNGEMFKDDALSSRMSEKANRGVDSAGRPHSYLTRTRDVIYHEFGHTVTGTKARAPLQKYLSDAVAGLGDRWRDLPPEKRAAVFPTQYSETNEKEHIAEVFALIVKTPPDKMSPFLKGARSALIEGLKL